MELYFQIKSDYMNDGVSQTVKLIIWNILRNPNIPCEIRNQSLYRLLVGVCEELIFNEIEAVYWSIFLEDYVWTEIDDSLHDLLLFSGFAVKKEICDSVEPFLFYLETSHDKFLISYEIWEQNHSPFIQIGILELNSKYQKLTSFDNRDSGELFNFNFYVDDILHACPPYSIPELKAEADDKKDENERAESFRSNSFSLFFENKRMSSSDNLLPDLATNASTGQSSLVYNPGLLQKIDSICNVYLNVDIPKIVTDPSKTKKKRSSLLSLLSDSAQN
ncbi:unnamed protein product [Blepharisma stoltei]|uniref:Uncharacterized protein n=1 Tax=Blepharisma stoltei TaxID=1481888 RepID=A0AAU9JEL3_9CILI|nr:unnamed protein product [Blepharisma stoltei]